MLTLPENKSRPAQTYIYVPFTVTMRQMQRPADEGFPVLFAYIEKHGLPPHPLVAEGYPSIGCSPCTSKARRTGSLSRELYRLLSRPDKVCWSSVRPTWLL